MEMPPLVEPIAMLTGDEISRYSRHIAIPQISVLGQQRLKSAKVLCVGAGGLGSPVLMYLTAAGVGRVGIVEFDKVEESNLQRQVIHGQSDIGTSKAQSAKAKMEEINSYVDVVTHEVRLNSSNVMEIFSEYDLIIDGTDNFATRYLINDACVLLQKPYIWGSILRFDGQASVFWATHGPCYRCLHPMPSMDTPNCAEAGVLGVLCASIGSIQTSEAIKLIVGIGDLLIGSVMIFDALAMSYRSIDLAKDPECVICGDNPTQTALLDDYEAFCAPPRPFEITVRELKTKIDSCEDFILIDVRERHEFEIVRIPGSLLMPLAGFSDGSAILNLPRNKEIILHCRSGVRSATALALLRGAGFTQCSHVQGGVIAWAQQIDPTCAVY